MQTLRNRWRCLWPTSGSSVKRSNGMRIAHWKVVGWIEALNDLVYFIDLLQQIREEQKSS